MDQRKGPLASKKRAFVFPETVPSNSGDVKYPPASSILLVGDVGKTAEILTSLDPELVSPFALVVADIPYLLEVADWDKNVGF